MVGVALSMALGSAVVAPSVSGAAGAVTARLSLNLDGLDPDDSSFEPSITPDGRYVAFASDASDLVPGDENFSTDVFVLDTQTGEIERVSVASDGTEADDASYAPWISNNGCRIAFNSDSDELVDEDWNGGTDVFVHDRCDPGFGTKLASIWVRPNNSTVGCPAGTYYADYGTDWDERPSISGDGTRVLFATDSGADECWANADENWSTDIFVHDFTTNSTKRVSQIISGEEGAYQGVISQNGQYAAFRIIQKVNKTTVPICPSFCWTSVVVRRDIDTLAWKRVSETNDSKAPDGPSFAPSMSADGRYVAFWSNATNLGGTPDTNGLSDVYVRDMATTTTQRASVAVGGGQSNGVSREPAMSRDGSTVAFTSLASNLVGGPDSGFNDVFVRHLDHQQTLRASTTHDGSVADGASSWPAVNTNGDKVVFQSDASQLVPDDNNDSTDIFSYPEGDIDLTPPSGVAITTPAHGGWNLHRSVPVGWTASDPSGIAYHDVVFSVTRWNGAPGAYVSSWAKGDQTTATGTNLWGAYGRTYCFKTRAQDNAFNLSAWSAPKCSATPLNAWHYSYSKGWKRYSQANSFAKYAARSATTGATITRTGIVAEKIALVATRCSTCGTVSVKLNGKTLKNISLYSPTTKRSQVIEVANRAWPYKGTLTVHVTSTGGRLVIVEGIGLYQI